MPQKGHTIPIAFKTADRELLDAAAERLGKPVSTMIRESSVAVARLVLEQSEGE
jgi:uncharacterized protein (DUF1778 family)